MSGGPVMRSHMIDLPGGRFHYQSWGAERDELPAMVLLHGITSSALSWVRVGSALAGRYRVHALDMRGHGESIKPPAGVYSLRHTADDAAAFIVALGLDNPVVMGHSWGGATAMVLASGTGSYRPVPSIARLILEDPAHHFGSGDVEERIAYYTKDIGRPAEELRVEIAADNPGWSEEDVEGKVDAVGKLSREAVISVFYDAGKDGEILPLLANISAPTLLMRADPALRTTLDDADWAEAKRLLSAHSRAVQIDGATHNIHRSKFDAFMQAVNDFLETGS